VSGSKVGIYCLKHKKDNMVNITEKKCYFEDCYNIPKFNFPNDRKNSANAACFEHKKDGMFMFYYTIFFIINILLFLFYFYYFFVK
jgi:hypothetical protein